METYEERLTKKLKEKTSELISELNCALAVELIDEIITIKLKLAFVEHEADLEHTIRPLDT